MEIFRFPTLQTHFSWSGLRTPKTTNVPPLEGLGSYDYYISMGRWTLEFNKEEPLKNILMWVRLLNRPIHFFNQLAVTRIGNFIGKTVRLGLVTAEGARVRYVIENRTFLVGYESLENICASCGFYGHKSDGFNPAPAC
ncbi:hypothetical protein LINPERPRIM_LOCUS30577 [Linum perenne]